MTRFGKSVLLLSLLGVTSGCAVISKDDCLRGDWYKVGYDVAMDGETDRVGAFNKRAEVCSKHGVVAEQADFDDGYAEGQIAYCETDNAVKLGVRGKSNAFDICDEEESPGFTAAWQAGYKLYELRREETYARNELQRLESEEYRNRRRIGDLRRSIDESSSEDFKRDALRRIRYLRRDIQNLRYDADGWRERYYRAKEAADTYQEFLELEYDEI